MARIQGIHVEGSGSATLTGVAAGNTLVYCVCGGSNTNYTISETNGPNRFAANRPRVAQLTFTGAFFQIFAVTAPTSGTYTVTIDGGLGGGNEGSWLEEHDDIGAYDSAIAAADNTDTTSPYSLTSGTPSNAASVVFSYFGPQPDFTGFQGSASGTTSWTASNYTSDTNTYYSGAFESTRLSSAAPVTVNWTKTAPAGTQTGSGIYMFGFKRNVATGATMAAALVGNATLTAALSTQKPLAATLAGVSTLTAALTTQKRLAASLAGVSTLTAALTTQKRLAASLAGVSTLGASLSTAIPLSATAAAVATLTANLSTTPVGFAAVLSSQATLSAALSTSIPLQSNLVAVAALSGALSTSIRFAAGLSGVSSLTAGLSTAKPLAAAFQSVATLSGTMASSAAGASLAAAFASVATLTASLTGGTPAVTVRSENEYTAPRRHVRSFKPLLQRILDAKNDQRVKPEGTRAAKRARAIEREAADLVLDLTAGEDDFRALAERWASENPVVPDVLAGNSLEDLFMAQVAFRLAQQQREEEALQLLAARRARIAKTALLALLLA